MDKIPQAQLVRRKNVFYFRLVVPAELCESAQVCEFTQSLKTDAGKRQLFTR
ncbi:DUF6538 domain-containing protein [Methylomicrobium album]|uniref:DUF6538 domain-containing protein n=1 Tax=Methylomicrobium TaxID=39773 RepID=UPI003CCB6EA9